MSPPYRILCCWNNTFYFLLPISCFFTLLKRWRFGQESNLYRIRFHVRRWWELQDSDLRPHACEACALPAELSSRIYVRPFSRKKTLRRMLFINYTIKRFQVKNVRGSWTCADDRLPAPYARMRCPNEIPAPLARAGCFHFLDAIFMLRGLFFTLS